MSEHAAPATTPSGGGGFKKFLQRRSLIILGVVALLFFARRDLELLFKSAMPEEQFADKRAKGIANEQISKELVPFEDAVRKNPTDSNINALRQKRQELHDRAARIVGSGQKSGGDTKGCPDSQRQDNKGFYFSTAGCSVDSTLFVWPRLLNPWDAEVYSVRLTALDGSSALVVPDIQPYPANTHNLAERIGEPYNVNGAVVTDWRLRGDIKYLPHGGAYAVEFVRK